MVGEMARSDCGSVEAYELFCRTLGIDSSATKSCQIFSIYLRYGRKLSEEAVAGALAQIRQAYRFGSCA